MTLQEFVNKYNGKKIEVAGSSALNQCVDLANAYIKEVLGLPIIEWTNAKDFPLRGGDNYTFIPNTPEGVPQEGDLIVWGGTYGHIAIFLRGDVNSFTSFDQNFPEGSACHEQWHNYANVTGWMRPKYKEPMITISTATFEDLVTKATKYDEFVSHGYQTADDVDAIIQKQQQEIQDKNNQLAECDANQDKINELESIIASQNDRIAELERELVAFIERNEELARDLDECQSVPENPSEGNTGPSRPIWERIWIWINTKLT